MIVLCALADIPVAVPVPVGVTVTQNRPPPRVQSRESGMRFNARTPVDRL